MLNESIGELVEPGQYTYGNEAAILATRAYLGKQGKQLMRNAEEIFRREAE